MRIKVFLGIAAAMTFLLYGCGHKGPLLLPAPKIQATQAFSQSIPSSQQLDASPLQQGK